MPPLLFVVICDMCTVLVGRLVFLLVFLLVLIQSLWSALFYIISVVAIAFGRRRLCGV
jgi:hypothetical protein